MASSLNSHVAESVIAAAVYALYRKQGARASGADQPLNLDQSR